MARQSGVFVLKGDETLVPMQATQFETELDFQKLLSKFPSLLVGDQIDVDDPRRFLLIKQEAAIGHDDDAARWSLDHLFLDQDGVPTLVEVKRRSDSRLRREVIGQMLDYAANFQSTWSAAKVVSNLEAACMRAGTEVDATIVEFLGSDRSSDSFWASVDANIKAGKLRLLFVADHIPTELRSIVEFLNKQMNPAEVLAIELQHFVGEGLRTIVPVVFGQTREALNRKAVVKGDRWTEERILEAFDNRFSEADAAAARSVLEAMKRSGMPLVYGTGRADGSVYPLLKPRGIAINPAYLSTDGKIWLQLKSLEGKPVFDDLEKRRELLRRFAAVDGSGLSDAAINGWAGVPLARVAADPRGTEKIAAALNWIVEQVKAAG